MLKNKQITIVILMALGFLIYKLCLADKTYEGLENGPKDVKPAKEEVKPELLKKILAEEKAVVPIKKDTKLDVFQFEPNDNQEAGADLKYAFEQPITKQERPDAVDINKNNVKKYVAKDFLPKEINNEWFDTDFSQAKFNINDDKLINTDRYVIGVNTVGQSLKNASHDIRGTIPNPKFTVSPWNNSTYEPDFNIRPLC
jgi:hypothetical protein